MALDAKRCLSPNIPRAHSDDHISEKQRSRTYNSCPPTPDYQSNSQTRFVIPESAGETNVDVRTDSKSGTLGKSGKEGAVGFQQKRPVSRQGSWRQVNIHSFVSNNEHIWLGRLLFQESLYFYLVIVE